MIYSTFIEAEGAFATQLNFLAPSISDDETRYFMNFLFVEDSEAPDDRKDKTSLRFRGVATDGRRLHIVDPLDCPSMLGLEPGFWRMLKTGRRVWLAKRVDEPGQYPNYKKVIPSGTPVFSTSFAGFRLGGTRYRSDQFPELVKFLRAFPEATAINLQYLSDLGLDAVWKVSWWAPNKGILFTSGERSAVIMPMQFD